MTHTTALLPEPLRVKLPGRRAQALSAAVLRDGRVVAVFESEKSATAYQMRLNRWQKEALGQ